MNMDIFFTFMQLWHRLKWRSPGGRGHRFQTEYWGHRSIWTNKQTHVLERIFKDTWEPHQALIFLPPKKFVTKSLEANRSRPEWPCHCLTSDWRTTYCKALISNISLSCKFAFLGISCWVTGGGFTSEFPAMAELSLRLHMFPLWIKRSNDIGNVDPDHVTDLNLDDKKSLLLHRQANGLVLVFSLDRPSSFEEVIISFIPHFRYSNWKFKFEEVWLVC